MRGLSRDESTAAASFRSACGDQAGALDAAQKFLDEAVRLGRRTEASPEGIVAVGSGAHRKFAATPEYWEAVMSLGERDYYPPIEMEGIPAPFLPRKAWTAARPVA